MLLMTTPDELRQGRCGGCGCEIPQAKVYCSPCLGVHVTKLEAEVKADMERLKKLETMEEQCRVSDEAFNFHLKRANAAEEKLRAVNETLELIGAQNNELRERLATLEAENKLFTDNIDALIDGLRLKPCLYKPEWNRNRALIGELERVKAALNRKEDKP